jgi:hypothetical protein
MLIFLWKWGLRNEFYRKFDGPSPMIQRHSLGKFLWVRILQIHMNFLQSKATPNMFEIFMPRIDRQLKALMLSWCVHYVRLCEIIVGYCFQQREVY